MTQEEHPDFEGRWPEDIWVHGAGPQRRAVAELKADMACYYGMMSFIDQELGRILIRLDELGVAENTLVIFTTDHGHFLGQHGLTEKAVHHYEDLIRIPFIVRWPGRVPAGHVSPALQNLIDLAPTFARAAGLAVPGMMTGLDQGATWAGGAAARSYSVTENHFGARYFHLRTYVNARYKITVYKTSDDGELFDLQEDPGETHNLWRSPEAAALKTRLLLEFMQATLRDEPERMPRICWA
jgi:arylsulfatase A-like enzyme